MADFDEGRRPNNVHPLPDLIPSGTSSDRSSSSTMASLASIRGVETSSSAPSWHHHQHHHHPSAPAPKIVTDTADGRFDLPPVGVVSFASSAANTHRPEPVRVFTALSSAAPDTAPGGPLPRAVGNLDSDNLEKLQQAANYANLAVRASTHATGHPTALMTATASLDAPRQRQPSAQGSGWESGDEIPNLSSSSQASSGESDHVLTPDSVLMAYRLEVPAVASSMASIRSSDGVAAPVASEDLSDRLSNLDTLSSDAGKASTVERNPTLRARPQHLSRLPSHATDATARPSPPSTGSSAAQTPAAAQPSDPMAGLVASGSVAAGASSSGSLQSSAFSSSPNLADVRPSSSRSSGGFDASRDSWRSLLPEEDSLYPAEDGHPRSAKPHRTSSIANSAASISGLSMASSDAGSARSVSVADSRRFSSESHASFQSAFSHSLVSPRLRTAPSSSSGNVADWATTESWRSLLPESDSAYASTRNASLPGTTHALPTAPASSAAASMTTSAATVAAARRHASFSAVDGRDGGSSDLRMSAGNVPSSAKRMSVTSTRSPTVATTLAPSGRLSSFFSSSSSSRASPSTPLTLTSEGVMSRSPGRVASILSAEALKYDDDDRESWPCSRGSTATSAASCASSGDGNGNGSRPGTATSNGTAGSPIIPTYLPPAMQSMGSFPSSDTSRSLASSGDAYTSRPASLSGREPTNAESSATSTGGSKGTPTPRSRVDEDATLSRASSMAARAQPMSPSFSVSPGSVTSLPFLESRPAPPETSFNIRTEPNRFLIQARLPGFSLEYITLATKNRVILQIVADKWDDQGGHFEKRVRFNAGADLRRTSASFDGKTLTVTVPRRPQWDGEDDSQEPFVVLNPSPTQAAVSTMPAFGVGAPTPPSLAASATSI